MYGCWQWVIEGLLWGMPSCFRPPGGLSGNDACWEQERETRQWQVQMDLPRKPATSGCSSSLWVYNLDRPVSRLVTGGNTRAFLQYSSCLEHGTLCSVLLFCTMPLETAMLQINPPRKCLAGREQEGEAVFPNYLVIQSVLLKGKNKAYYLALAFIARLFCN